MPKDKDDDKDKIAEFTRIYRINRILNERGSIHRSELAKELGVSTRTVTNYINTMATMGAEIESSKSGYRYANPFTLKPIDEYILLFYSFMKNFVNTHNYVPPYISRLIMDRINFVINDLDFIKISDKIQYDFQQYEEIDETTFKKIIESFITKMKIKIDYVTGEGVSVTRVIEPLKLLNYSGSWYLAAQLGDYDTPALYNVSRINHITVTRDGYRETISVEDVNNSLNDVFGIYKINTGHNKIQNATIRFYNSAYYITKNQFFHKDQVKKILKDENNNEFVEFSFPVRNFSEILGKVLQYHVNAEAVAPEEFRKLWINSIKMMYEKFVK